ncbi:hypothetical protein ABZ897_08150 [Nonomuraea sp. NPDC046802]|uniref:hypothetical protein n=1 Tax=Nonomuraea sp. NPDC046802 TaxID=3154919 RepID=UPI0033D2D0E1
MTKLAQSALAALTLALLAILLLSHGTPSANEPAPVAAAETLPCDHPPQTEETFDHAWVRDDQVLKDKSPSGTVTFIATHALVAVKQTEDPPYGPRRQRSGALSPVLQVFRC